MAGSNNSDGGVNKAALYGEWLRGEKWKRNLQKQVAHKALDIAEAEDVNLSVNKSTGISTTGAIGIAVAAGLGPALLGLAMLFKGSPPPDSNYGVFFYDKDGRPIPVKHISELEKK